LSVERSELNIERSAPRGAVFLSYASQDAEAAKRICEALRTAGVEVWFDQSELRGGDAWDQKIRKQIKECALFVPVISANTQARGEGYFRLEWKLAVDRSHLMADDAHFLFPVVIDDTPDAGARVPDKFRDVQWTRLNVKDTPETLAVRVSKVLGGAVEAGRSRPAGRDGDVASPNKRTKPAWLTATWSAIGLVFAVYYGLFPLWKSLRPAESKATPVAPAIPVPVASGPSSDPPEVQQLVTQARELIYDPDSGHNEFSLAEKLLKRATELAPLSGSAWGASALLNQYLFARGYDMNRERLVRSQADGENALRLDPRSVDALLALGLRRLSVGENAQAKEYLDRAQAADPQNVRVIIAQAWQLPDRAARGQVLLDMAARVPRPAELFYYAGDQFTFLGRFDDAAAALEHAIAAQPFWRTLVYRAGVEGMRTADPVKMIGWLDRVPEIRRDEPRVAVMRYYAAMLQRDAGMAVRVISDLAVDYLEDNFFVGPKAFLIAQAQELAGHPELATEQWQIAERIVREKMAADPAEIQWRSMLAVILAGEHRTAEARTVAEACAADARLRQVSNHLNGNVSNTGTAEYVADAYARLGDPVRAIEVLRNSPYRDEWGGVSAALLAVEPRWAPLHGQPGYAELVEEMKSAENRKPGAPGEIQAKPDDKSVAVLAFDNLSDDKGNEYFSDGISDELINTLGKVPGLKVPARTSSFHFKGKDTPIPEIARQLGVAYVIEGSVQRAGEKVKISARLSKAADGFQVWTDSFLRDAKDVFAVEEEIAGLIAAQLSLKLGASSAAATASVNPQALEFYLQAGEMMRLRDTIFTNIDRVEDLLNRALALEPNFARAQALLAVVWVARGSNGSNQTSAISRFSQRHSPERARIEAKARQAIALDPTAPEPHAALATGMWIWWDRAGAENELRTALSLNPSDAFAHQQLGTMAMDDGRMDDAIAEARLAVQLDPLSQDSIESLARKLQLAGRYTEAIATYDRALALADSEVAREHKAYALAQLGQKEAAMTLARSLVLEHLRFRTFAVAGTRAEAEKMFPSTESENRSYYLFMLGRTEAGLAALDPAEMRSTYLHDVLFEPWYDPVREDPRFKKFLETLGVTDAHARAQAWRKAHPPEKLEAKQ
jgi:TolB-like protein/Tfp pilus assembly protein PilF